MHRYALSNCEVKLANFTPPLSNEHLDHTTLTQCYVSRVLTYPKKDYPGLISCSHCSYRVALKKGTISLAAVADEIHLTGIPKIKGMQPTNMNITHYLSFDTIRIPVN